MNHFGTLLPFATSVKTNLTKIMISWQEILKQSLLTAYIVYFTRKEEDRPNVIRHVWHVRKMSNNYSHSHGEPAARRRLLGTALHARRLPTSRRAIVHTSALPTRARRLNWQVSTASPVGKQFCILCFGCWRSL